MNAAITSAEMAEVATREFPTGALISIRAPTAPRGCLASRGPRLDLQFDDLPRWMPLYDPPQRTHAADIVRFARTLDPADGLIVHCAAGISRSSAALIGVLATLDLDIRPSVDQAVARTVALGWRDPAVGLQPNPRLTALLDLELAAGGELLRLVLRFWGDPMGRTWREILDDAEREW